MYKDVELHHISLNFKQSNFKYAIAFKVYNFLFLDIGLQIGFIIVITV